MTPVPRDGHFPWWYPRKSHDAWSRVRKRGARRFVLVNGLLLYGGLMFLIVGLLSQYVRDPAGLTLQRVALGALVWGLAGLTWGAVTWHFSERNFLKHATQSGTPES